jgi:predicted PP-loop superfamily ATPase
VHRIYIEVGDKAVFDVVVEWGVRKWMGRQQAMVENTIGDDTRKLEADTVE